MQKNILLVGATGRQGRALIRALRPTPPANGTPNSTTVFRVLALTRNPTSATARLLASEDHVTLVSGDLEKPETIREIFEGAVGTGGIWGVFVVLAFPGLGANADGEEKHGKMLADLGLEFLVSLILRPGFFMENYDGAVGSITAGVLMAGLKPTTTIQLVAVDDIGYVAAGVFQQPEAFASKILVVVGDILTMTEQQESYHKATGKPLPSTPRFLARALIAINGHTQGLISDMERVHTMRANDSENESQMATARKAYPSLTTFEAWATSRRGKGSNRDKNWNQVSVGRLIRGKQ
ncbi:hypothetical protein BD779DRAFT_1668660 [Infundibulicybe gibba]|nr:hypothetical protein BD779DRAFT_1668660 [Infundibulicybe gibba]